MIQHKDHFHGSDLEKIEEIYGIKKEEIKFQRQCEPAWYLSSAARDIGKPYRRHRRIPGQGIHFSSQMHRRICGHRS